MYRREGKAAGLYADLVGAIVRRMGETAIIEAEPWERVLEGVSSGMTGAAGLYKTPERVAIIDYSDELFRELLLVFVRKGNQFAFRSVADLEGKTLGVISGWSYGKEFDEAMKKGLFQVEGVNLDEENFRKLAQGTVDCVVAPLENGLLQIANNGLSNIFPLDKPLLANPAYLGFAKRANMVEFLHLFNMVLKQMKADGEYDRIVDQSRRKELGPAFRTMGMPVPPSDD